MLSLEELKYTAHKAPVRTAGAYHTVPFSCSSVFLLIAHLSVLKRVVHIKRGILLAGSVLDHSWVLRAETWVQGALDAKGIPRNFPKLLVALSTETR